MLFSWLKKWLPKKNQVKNHKSLRPFQRFLREPNLWQLNKQSIARGVAVGLFIAFIPLPFQMLLAALSAVLLKANLPIAIVLTWITNPITFVPINYFTYWVGNLILRQPVSEISFSQFNWTFTNFAELWSSFIIWISQFGKAFFVGLPIVSLGSAILGYLLVNLIWLGATFFHLKIKK